MKFVLLSLATYLWNDQKVLANCLTCGLPQTILEAPSILLQDHMYQTRRLAGRSGPKGIVKDFLRALRY